MKCRSKPRKLGIRRADWRHFFRPKIGILSVESGGYARSGVEGLILAGDSNTRYVRQPPDTGVEGLILARDSNGCCFWLSNEHGAVGLILAGERRLIVFT